MANRQDDISVLKKYLRFVNYLGAAMLYLKDNFLLREPLQQFHIKDRILGHWGTVPGLNFIYAHLNYLISKHDAEMMFVCGPGHGAPAVLANLFMEQTLAKFYPQIPRNGEGAGWLLKHFSWPGGFPSHVTPMVPGSILEGGELGYSLSTAYGATFDNPNLIVACVIGDGEAESGPLAASWNSNKFLDPATSGAVLPILHVNGYKISNPTIYGTMSDSELTSLFTGFGYSVHIVEGNDVHEEMMETLESAYQEILTIQKQARLGKKVVAPKWPMIILRTLKGWTGVKEFHGQKIEGNFASHGIPLHDPKTNPESFALLKKWLESYKIQELVERDGTPKSDILKFIPKDNLKMGMNQHVMSKKIREDLKLPDPKRFEVKLEGRGSPNVSNIAAGGANFLRDIFILNKNEKNFRFLCPDEMESNKMHALLDATDRAYVWPIQPHDKHLSTQGRVMEMLSEHTLQGWLQGYLLTGRHGIFATYEAFAGIVSSMVDQYAKFIKQARHVNFRPDYSSLNYILTSVGWRQEHNGYSHQNPSFISNILEKHGEFCSVYFPPDANSLTVILEDCLKRKNGINVITVGKQNMPQWLTIDEAKKQLKLGMGVWNFASHKNPDVVLAGCGDSMTQECMAAISILREMCPELKIRFVNVSELTSLGLGDEKYPCRLGDNEFDEIFTQDRPIIFNFHGYPGVIRKLLGTHPSAHRFIIHGYSEEGTTTTPFDMLVKNHVDRYHLAMELIRQGALQNPALEEKRDSLVEFFNTKISEHQHSILEFGKDPDEIEGWKWR